jgi:dTDP-4-dehydrorhamnose reductase
MKTILLGPNGQLGTDVQAANVRKGGWLSLTPVGRSSVDLCDIEAATNFLRESNFDCLINCSSYHRTDEVERNAQLAFTINAHLVQRLAQICFEKQARLVHVSTDYVFGGLLKSLPFTEADCKAPVNVYGASKAMGEDLALLTGAKVWVLRVASLFGTAGASGKGGNFVETMIRIGKEKGTLRVVADQTMSPTSTKDIAEVIIGMLQKDVAPGIWNVVNSGAASWYEFAKQIIARSNIKASVLPIDSGDFPTIARRPVYSVLDNTKLCDALGSIRAWQDALDEYLIAKGYRNG